MNTSGKRSVDALEEEDNQSEETVDESEFDDAVTYSTQIVTVDSLNVRSGPSIETDIVGVVTLNQELDVEDNNNPDG